MKTIALKNEFLSVELLDPTAETSSGNRFCGGGWISKMSRSLSGSGYFVEESIHPERPEFGCPIEFIRPLPLSHALSGEQEQIKIGVGKVRHQEGTSRFTDHLLKSFPWEVHRAEDSDEAPIHFCQTVGSEDGYGYILDIRMALLDETMLVDIRLENTGMRTLDTFMYIHPFFHEQHPLEAYWFQAPCRMSTSSDAETVLLDRQNLDRFPPPDTLVQGSELSTRYNWIATGNIDAGDTFRIASETAFDRLNFWRKPGTCYAIEPLFDLLIDPGQKAELRLRLETGNELDPLKPVIDPVAEPDITCV